MTLPFATQRYPKSKFNVTDITHVMRFMFALSLLDISLARVSEMVKPLLIDDPYVLRRSNFTGGRGEPPTKYNTQATTSPIRSNEYSALPLDEIDLL
jgi:hypothetical protein